MDFSIEKKSHVNSEKYDKEVLDLAYKYSKEAYKEFKELIRGIILFGSSARIEKRTEGGDIDLLVVFDDIYNVPTEEVVQAYKLISEKLILKISKRIHITTIRYTTFFDQVRTCDPIGINVLRDGIALVDTGFFDPLQVLLRQGRIRPTYESIWTYMDRAPKTLHNSRWHLFRACEDLYWSVMDSAHAAIMKTGTLPTSPKHMSELFNEKLVGKTFTKKHVETIQFFVDLYKAITKRELRDLTGQQYEKYYLRANEFVRDVEAYLRR